MAETAYTHALTTKARVKDLIGISNTNFDSVFDRLINSVTDFIEGYCSRRFKETTYTNEVYSIENHNEEYLILKQSPVTSLTKLEYSVGLPSSKGWTEYAADDYEVMNDGKNGMIRVHGGLYKGTNTARATYVAGYKINWTNAGDSSTHTLPADLTSIAERMVIKLFKRREAEGKDSEGFNGSTVSWLKTLLDEDKAVLNRYTRLPYF